ncbi:MAG: hypothetical protein RL097_155 [Candidatus Parcubacteria bacterium]|jgi:hypothetical protein
MGGLCDKVYMETANRFHRDYFFFFGAVFFAAFFTAFFATFLAGAFFTTFLATFLAGAFFATFFFAAGIACDERL